MSRRRHSFDGQLNRLLFRLEGARLTRRPVRFELNTCACGANECAFDLNAEMLDLNARAFDLSTFAFVPESVVPCRRDRQFKLAR